MLVTSVGPNSQAGAIADMIARGAGPAAGAGARLGALMSASAERAGGGARARGVSDGGGLREETLLQQKLAKYATQVRRAVGRRRRRRRR